jgi:D-alanyl-lipoteichoic acid acyltransferase DltB (MBOAT superfamily)
MEWANAALFSPLAILAAYLLAGRWLVARPSPWREPAFALLNLGMVYVAFFLDPKTRVYFPVYLALVLVQYLVLRWRPGAEWKTWAAFLVPIAILAAVRYVPQSAWAALSGGLRNKLADDPNFSWGSHLVGLSYLAFRTSYLVLEARNGLAPTPGFWQYFGFAFFAPTLSVGPINTYCRHRLAFEESSRPNIPAGRALLRVLVGAVKYKYFSPLLNQLTYAGLLLDGHPHAWTDLPVAAVAYYLYLYCNFSGSCDIAVGCAGLMGISVAENFDRPFAARNMRNFWNRWHITLSQYMRDVVFSPLSKLLVRMLGPARLNLAVALTALVVFLLVGVWHGTGWHYLAWGLMHGIGVAGVHYYTVGLKKWLGRDGFEAYNKNRVIHAIAVVLTFAYVTAALFLFANDWNSMKNIFAMLQ